MQVQAPTPPVPPQVTAPSPATTSAITAVQGIPHTVQEMAALRAARSEMSNQLISVQGRRDDLAQQLRSAGPVDREGLQSRITQLDQRIMNLEHEIDVSGQAIIAAPPSLLASTQTASEVASFIGVSPGEVAPLTALFMVAVLAPIAIGFGRMMWRRGRSAPASAASPETNKRLERIEQAVDAIAIEVERISEGQRFQTRLMTERQPNLALGAGQAPAEPIRVREYEPLRANTPQA